MTYNVNGMQLKSKREKIFNYVKEKISSGMCFFQECHSTLDSENEWKKNWNGQIYFSHGQSNSTGCAIAFSENLDIKIDDSKISKDEKGRILILEATYDSKKLLLINLYNANTEKEQLEILSTLCNLLKNHNPDGNFHAIFSGDFNVIFDTVLDAAGGNPSLKKKSLAKIISITESLDACDAFRVCHPNSKRFTFRRKNPSLQRRLDYIFLSNNFQEYISKIEIIPSFMSDHSPVIMKLDFDFKIERGKYGWKFNSGLLSDDQFTTGCKNHINQIKNNFDETSNPHIKWEYLKYECRKFAISFSKKKKKADLEEQKYHEDIIARYETSVDKPTEDIYNQSKIFHETLIQNRTKGAILRSKCSWYEDGEKSTKFFLNLEKRKAVNSTIKKLIDKDSGRETTNSKEVLAELHSFYSTLFTKKCSVSSNQCSQFLRNANLPLISDEHKTSCDKTITLEEITENLFNMNGGKSPGNDGLSVEFYKFFWDDLKILLFESYEYSISVGFLSASQKQAIIKLLEKRDKDKRYICNWRPISLLNVDTKIFSKTAASRLIPVLPTIINADQTAYVKGRFIGESIRLVSDILDYCKNENIEAFILTADLEKAFDSIDHTFLLCCLEKFGFGKYFLDLIKLLLNGNESCVMNSGTTTSYFPLKRGARQGDPIAAYLFIIVLEVFFILVRSNPNIKKLKVYDDFYLLTAYADDTTFFVQDIESIKEIMKVFDIFSKYSGLKLNVSKCEICGIGVLNDVPVALCGFKNVILSEDSIRVLGVHFSYNPIIHSERNFLNVIKNVEGTLKAWKGRFLSIQGKIIVFKTLGFSKIIYVSYLTNVPRDVLQVLESIQKSFIWDGKKAKIKHSTLTNDYCNGGLKDIDICSKFDALHLSWLSRFYNDNKHPWCNIFKAILIKNFFIDSVFFPNLEIEACKLVDIPSFYRVIIESWSKISMHSPKTSSLILSESVWYNTNIKIDNKTVSPSFLSLKKQLCLNDLFCANGSFIPWDEFSTLHEIPGHLYFRWIQLRNSIPTSWLAIIREFGSSDLVYLFPHLNINERIVCTKKLTSTLLYKLLQEKFSKPPTSINSHETKLNVMFDKKMWEKIFMIPRFACSDSQTRIFQFKILHNILFLNDRLYNLNLSDTKLCSLCKEVNETPTHLFSECTLTLALWKSLQTKLKDFLVLDNISPQSAILGFTDQHSDINTVNHLLLIFKYFVYKNRSKNLSQNLLFKTIKSTIDIELKSCALSARFQKINKKWEKIIHLF